MSQHSRIAIVTGANKGIGLAIVRQLALQYPRSPFNNGPFLIYLTARNRSRGEEALKTLADDPQLTKAKALSAQGGLSDIAFHELDISQTKSVQNFRDFLKEKHPEGLDFLINNAGIAMDGFDYTVVKKTIEANYYGTLEVCQSLYPLLKPTARLVNVASMAGHLSKYSPTLQEAFLSATTVPEITALMEANKASVQRGTHTQDGWPSSGYMVSKAGMIGMTRCLAREERGERLINVCCPGYVKTDMTRGGGYKTPDQGAQTPVMLALEDIQGKTGLFWQEEKELKW